MMARRVRRLAVVVLVLLVVGAIALVLATRPKLEDARDGVDRAWTPLRGPLSERYAKLAEANTQLAAAGGGDRNVSRALGLRLGRWGELRRAKDGPERRAAEMLGAEALALARDLEILGWFAWSEFSTH